MDSALDIELLRRSLTGRVLGGRLVYRRTVGSTMDEARQLAEEGTPDGTVVIAEEQTDARGRFDRVWLSPPLQNLYLSIVLRPPAARLPQVNMAATLAVSRAAEQLTGLSASIKWPNDVRINGHKLSGILIETSVVGAELDYAVVGLGINVNLDPAAFPEISGSATSLLAETGVRMDRTRVMIAVLKHMDDLYARVKSGRSITDLWRARLDTLGRPVRVWASSRTVEGEARGVDEEGGLLVRTPEGATEVVLAGEVTLQGPMQPSHDDRSPV